MRLLGSHCGADRLFPARNRSALVLLAGGQQLPVQVLKVLGLGHRHPMVSPEVTSLAFDAALLVRFRWRAELRGETPMRAKSDEPRRLLALISAQDLLHRRFQIVVAKAAEDSAKVAKGQLVRFQKS